MVEGDGDLIDEMRCLEWLNEIMKTCWDEWILMEAADDICVSGNELWLGTLRNWVVCYFCVEIYLMEHFRSWGGWSLYLCVCVWCVRGNSFELEGAEEADEVAAAGGERLPDAAGLQVFQVKVVPSPSGETVPSSTECYLIPFVVIQF